MSNELQSHLMMASMDFSRLQAFVQNLRVKLRADGAVFRYLDFKDWTYPISMECGSGVFSKEFFAEYDGGWGLSDPHVRVGMSRHLPDRNIYICTDHYSQEDREKDPYFSEFLPRHNIKWLSGYLAQIDNQYAAGFALVRLKDREPFTEDDKIFMKPVIDILDDSIRLLLNGQRMKLVKRAMLAAIERGTDFYLCIDAQGRLLSSSEKADKALTKMRSIKKADDRIISRSPAGEEVLNEIKELARSHHDNTLKVTVEDVDGQSVPLICKPIRAEDGKLGENALGACVLLGEPRQPVAQMPLKAAGDVSMLTKTELLITEHAARGLSAPRIADEMGVQPSTVRTHLKHIHRKLRITNRSELVALFLGNSK